MAYCMCFANDEDKCWVKDVLRDPERGFLADLREGAKSHCAAAASQLCHLL